MSQWIAVVAYVIAVGVGATAVMDLWVLVLKRFGVPALDYALIGRWLGHMRNGKWFHTPIAKAEKIDGEAVLGWAAHYAIGVSYAALLIAVVGIEWAQQPTLLPAVLVGAGTVVAPFFVMQPALGSGVASRKTATPLFNCIKSITNHTVFGIGLFAAGWVVSRF